ARRQPLVALVLEHGAAEEAGALRAAVRPASADEQQALMAVCRQHEAVEPPACPLHVVRESLRGVAAQSRGLQRAQRLYITETFIMAAFLDAAQAQAGVGEDLVAAAVLLDLGGDEVAREVGLRMRAQLDLAQALFAAVDQLGSRAHGQVEGP